MKRGLVVVAIAVLGITIFLWLRRSSDKSLVGETGSGSNPASQPLPGTRSMRSADEDVHVLRDAVIRAAHRRA